ncbi:hypothetical protein A9K55_004807 [Cordyceps militaris]|uniref:C2H2-type domain-containing protein n=1 Tax=Cordyceps militaris TaxID=73501 RepID=A0A2H4SMG0_CORMI|nr:hypothetical protein A9K55_004807 [Cordyceps militaris]
MDLDEHYAPFPGAHATPTKLARPEPDVEEPSRHAIVPTLVYHNAEVQKARPAGLPAAQSMHKRPSLSAPAPVSVVLRPSSIKAHEYAEYEVTIQGKKQKSLILQENTAANMSLEAASTSDGPPRKKRGRPKGWRASVAYGDVRGSVGSSTAVRGGRSGRQKHVPNYSLKRRRKTVTRPDSPPPRELYLALKPTYLGFLCEWSCCKADLHNMDTLRRHVQAVHLKPQKQQCCLWGTCAGKGVTQHADRAALVKHVEQAHLVPMAWHVGDGPRNSWNWSIRPEADKETIPDFLKDKDGNQVTPSTQDQVTEDRLTHRANRRKLKNLIMRRDENLESESSDASEDEEMGSGL